MKLVKSRQAQEDLLAIWAYVSADSESAADKLLDRIDAKLSLLPAFPTMGAARDDIRSGLRMIVMHEYLILYRVVANEIEIVRVVHGRRDLGGIGL